MTGHETFGRQGGGDTSKRVKEKSTSLQKDRDFVSSSTSLSDLEASKRRVKEKKYFPLGSMSHKDLGQNVGSIGVGVRGVKEKSTSLQVVSFHIALPSSM